MRRRLFVLLLSLFVLGSGLVESLAAQNKGVQVVVIDAGHGGPKFPGATYGGYREKDINLQIALKLGKLIEKNIPGVKVVYTRTVDKQFSSDLSADLQARANIANRAGGDLFISIHANAARSTAARGFETLIMGESEKETRMNEEVLYANNKEEFLDMSDERTAAIVRAYLQNLQFTYGRYSEAMARLVQSNYTEAGYHSRGIKPQLLKVLYATDMPSVLTEVGFMSNSVDLKRMTSESGQQEIARALCNAVKDYVEFVRKTSVEESPAPAVEPTPVPKPEPKPETKPESKPEPKPEAPASGYTIQVMASPSSLALDNACFKGYRGRVRELKATGRYCYKYCYGTYATRGEAAADLAKLKQTFKDAFIVHFVGSEIR